MLYFSFFSEKYKLLLTDGGRKCLKSMKIIKKQRFTLKI